VASSTQTSEHLLQTISNLINPFLIDGFKWLIVYQMKLTQKSWVEDLLLLYKMEHGYSKLRSIKDKD